jgi:hypothetical protein
MQITLLGITSVDFDVIGQQLFSSYIIQILEKNLEYNDTLHQLFTDFKTANYSVRMEVLFNILIEFGIHRKLVGLIQMCLNETYSTSRIGKVCMKSFLF